MKLERYGIGIAKGLAVTVRHLFRWPVTVLYPEQRLTPSKRIRGNELVWNSAKCTICTTCAKTCPQGAIRLDTAVDPANPNKLTVTRFEVDTGYCISCGLCVEACPEDAIRMVPDVPDFPGYDGKPIAPRELVARVEQRLASHR